MSVKYASVKYEKGHSSASGQVTCFVWRGEEWGGGGRERGRAREERERERRTEQKHMKKEKAYDCRNIL